MPSLRKRAHVELLPRAEAVGCGLCELVDRSNAGPARLAEKTASSRGSAIVAAALAFAMRRPASRTDAASSLQVPTRGSGENGEKAAGRYVRFTRYGIRVTRPWAL